MIIVCRETNKNDDTIMVYPIKGKVTDSKVSFLMLKSLINPVFVTLLLWIVFGLTIDAGLKIYSHADMFLRKNLPLLVV